MLNRAERVVKQEDIVQEATEGLHKTLCYAAPETWKGHIRIRLRQMGTEVAALYKIDDDQPDDASVALRELESLLKTFKRHREATHEIRPSLCVTCNESTSAIETASAYLYEAVRK